MRLNHSDIIAEARRILHLAWPVMLTSLNWTLMHLIDVAIVGHSGPGELGALAAGRALSFITIIIGIASLSGIIVFTARLDGAGERHRCGDVLRQGLICAVVLGVPTAFAMHYWAAQITHRIGIAPLFVAEGSDVVRVMALAFPAQMVMTAIAYFLEGASRPGRAMVVNLLMLPLNAGLAWAWAGGHLGFPAAGAVGAVSATAVISLAGAVGMAVAVWTLPDAPHMQIRDLSLQAWRASAKATPGLIRFGIVPGIASGLEMAGFSFLIILSTRLGPTATDAFQTVFSLQNFAFAVAIGIASAAGVRTGNAIGEGNPRAAFSRTAIASGLLIVGMGGIALSYAVFGRPLTTLFSDQSDVRLLATAMLRILAPFMLCDGLQLICVYALRSMGDQVVAGINGIIAFFIVTGGLSYWLVMMLGQGPFSLIFAAAAGMVTAAVLQGGRFVQISRRPR